MQEYPIYNLESKQQEFEICGYKFVKVDNYEKKIKNLHRLSTSSYSLSSRKWEKTLEAKHLSIITMSFAFYANIKSTYSSFSSLQEGLIQRYWIKLENKCSAEKSILLVTTLLKETNHIRKQTKTVVILTFVLLVPVIFYLSFKLVSFTEKIHLDPEMFFSLFSSPNKAKLISLIILASCIPFIFTYRFLVKKNERKTNDYLLFIFRIAFSFSLIFLIASKLKEGGINILALMGLWCFGIAILFLLTSVIIKKLRKYFRKKII